jgi:hypothetical protein
MKISVLVPAYEMFGYGAAFLRQSFELLERQDYKNFEIVVGDQSNDRGVADLCKAWSGRLAIKHVDTGFCRGNPSSNLNAAQVYADGEIVKLLFQDDFLLNSKAMGLIAKGFDDAPGRSWLISGFAHSHDAVLTHRPFLPVTNERMSYGANTVGPPSAMAIRRRNYVAFNPDSAWLMDVAVYSEALKRLGPPITVAETSVISREWARQNTHELSSASKRREEFAALEIAEAGASGISAGVAHHAHNRLHQAMIDREHAMLRRPLSVTDRRENVHRLSTLSPTDRAGLLETYFMRRDLMDAEWRRAATLLMSFYTSDREVVDSVAVDLRTMSRESLGELSALQDFIDGPLVCRSYPTRLFEAFAPTGLPDGVEEVLSKLRAPFELGLEFSGRARGDDTSAEHLDVLRRTLLATNAALAAADRKGRVNWRMGRGWTDYGQQADACEEPAMIEIVVSSSASERARLASDAREDVGSFGFVLVVNPDGDGSALPAARARSRIVTPLVTVEQIFH